MSSDKMSAPVFKKNPTEPKMYKWPVLALLLFISPFNVNAEEPKFYWGVMAGVTQLSLSNSVVNPMNEDLNLKTLTGRLGFDFGKYLSVEGRVLASDSDNYWYGGYSAEVTYLGNISAKLNLPFGKERRVNVYGLVGYSSWKWTITQGSSTWDDTDDGVSYGIGVDLFADRVNALNIEVIRYLDSSIDSSNYTLDTASIGYLRRF
jgi:hypothetical protein